MRLSQDMRVRSTLARLFRTVPLGRVMCSSSATGKLDRKVAIITASTDGYYINLNQVKFLFFKLRVCE